MCRVMLPSSALAAERLAPRRQPREDPVVEVPAVGVIRLLKPDREIDIRLVGREGRIAHQVGEVEPSRENARHRGRHAIHVDDPADHAAGRMEAAPPEPVADQRLARSPGAAVGREERAETRAHMQSRGEETVVGPGAEHRLGAFPAGEVEEPVAEYAEPMEGTAVAGELLEFREGELADLGARRLVPALNLDQLIRSFVPERAQQYRIHHAEDRAVGRDAERQREHHGEGEPGALPQRAQGVPDVA